MPGTMLNTQSYKNSIQKTYKVLVADDHDIFRHGLKTLLCKYPFIKFKGEASNGKELKDLAKKEQPDLIFMDLHMPGGHGIEATTEILHEHPEIKIVVLSFYDDAITVERMMKLGASAYLTKNISFQVLDMMFEKVLNGFQYISPEAASNIMINKISPGPSLGTPEQGLWLQNAANPRQSRVVV